MQSRSDNLNWRVRGSDKTYCTKRGIEIEQGKQKKHFDYDYKKELKQIFRGYCYICNNSQHSQNYCPLARCVNCTLYGHTQKVCDFYTDESQKTQNVTGSTISPRGNESPE